MTTATLSPADLQLRDRAMRQLGWDSQVDSSAIGVSARDRVVTLTGFIDSYAGKLAAERAVKRAAVCAPSPTICRSPCVLNARMRTSPATSSAHWTSMPPCRPAYKPWSATVT